MAANRAFGSASASASAGYTVPAEAVEAFERDGAVRLRGLFSARELEAAAAGIERNIREPSPNAKVASRSDDPGFFFQDYCNWQRIPEYRELIFRSAAAGAAAQLMRASTVRLYHDHLLVKEPGTRQRTPWHQDQPYYNIDGRMSVSMWLPIDPVPRESSLEFIAGSHLGPWRMPRAFLDNEARWFPEGSLTPLPDIESNRPAYPIIGWAVEPGDAVFFHMLALHGAAGVGGERRRRVLSVRFMGEDIRHAPRRWKTSPHFPGLAEELPAGAEMSHPLFPVVWSRS
ncbi:MAG TPA: phytanoyl-CoA dioxygenase family protein [Steroidobacteraceae bacterium]|jgi:ectoine hydroxylase-related dioxygenase (phytanoyl-CoA dioxygenase family)|nr:phytanoyl-CoA dioxygenase family protein [Steroidobacteraceae bacterium]